MSQAPLQLEKPATPTTCGWHAAVLLPATLSARPRLGSSLASHRTGPPPCHGRCARLRAPVRLRSSILSASGPAALVPRYAGASRLRGAAHRCSSRSHGALRICAPFGPRFRRAASPLAWHGPLRPPPPVCGLRPLGCAWRALRASARAPRESHPAPSPHHPAASRRGAASCQERPWQSPSLGLCPRPRR